MRAGGRQGREGGGWQGSGHVITWSRDQAVVTLSHLRCPGCAAARLHGPARSIAHADLWRDGRAGAARAPHWTRLSGEGGS